MVYKSGELWGKPVTNKAELKRLEGLMAKLQRRQVSTAERAGIIKELADAFGITEAYNFRSAEKIIIVHYNASRNFLRIKELGIKVGDRVSCQRRPAVIGKISWNGNITVQFTDGRSPKGKLVSPYSIDPP